MAHPWINREFYEAAAHFEESEAAQEYYYRVMDTEVERNGVRDTVRNQILRAYAMLFCDDIGAMAGQKASQEDVEATADRLYVGALRFDPRHWYRMRYHFPVIDEDNYERFAALVISDLSAGPLHEAAKNGGDMLLVGAPNPLTMSQLERERQPVRVAVMPDAGQEGERI
ncbi:MAG: hypothetical protein J5927_02275 [Oscillospiraceae bacterium]|nr:hypothetical protein [Oscillospiraceae bacterium]